MMRFLGLRCQEIFGPRPYLYADGNYVVKIQERKKERQSSLSIHAGGAISPKTIGEYQNQVCSSLLVGPSYPQVLHLWIQTTFESVGVDVADTKSQLYIHKSLRRGQRLRYQTQVEYEPSIRAGPIPPLK